MDAPLAFVLRFSRCSPCGADQCAARGGGCRTRHRRGSPDRNSPPRLRLRRLAARRAVRAAQRNGTRAPPRRDEAGGGHLAAVVGRRALAARRKAGSGAGRHGRAPSRDDDAQSDDPRPRLRDLPAALSPAALLPMVSPSWHWRASPPSGGPSRASFLARSAGSLATPARISRATAATLALFALWVG